MPWVEATCARSILPVTSPMAKRPFTFVLISSAVHGHAELIKTYSGRIEGAADGHHALLRYELPAVLEPGLDLAVLRRHRLDLDFGKDAHARLLEPLGNDPGDHPVFRGEYGREELY